MALQLPISETDSSIGAAFPGAYARVIYGRTFAATVIITVNFYADEQARRGDKREFDQRHYEAQMADLTVEAGDHLHAPFYRHLKTLPEFANAIDVLTTPEPSVPPVVVEVPVVDPLFSQPTDGSVN